MPPQVRKAESTNDNAGIAERCVLAQRFLAAIISSGRAPSGSILENYFSGGGHWR